MNNKLYRNHKMVMSKDIDLNSKLTKNIFNSKNLKKFKSAKKLKISNPKMKNKNRTF